MTATEQKLKPVKCVVVPRSSPIDKYIAFKRVQLDLKDKFRIRIAFCDTNKPSIADFEAWEAMCDEGATPAHYLDIGSRKYHALAASASEVEAMASDTESGKTWNKLRELANQNNATGCLKNRRYSVAKLVRDVYDVVYEASQELVFDHGMEVVNAFFYPQNKRAWETLFTDEQFAEVRKLWEGFNVQEHEVLEFTLPLYLRQLFLSGRSSAEIIMRVSWWQKMQVRVDERKAAAKAKQYRISEFFIAGGAKKAGLVHVANSFEGEAFSFQYVGSGKLALGIVRSHRGHVHIQPSFKCPGLDLGAFYEELNRLEPGRWYYEGRFGSGKMQMLMNGSRQYIGITPTSLSDNDLIRLAAKHVTFSRK